MIRALAALVVLLASSPAFALEDADYAAAVAGTARDQIIPAYQRLEDRALDLRDGLGLLCKEPTSDSLIRAQARFRKTTEAWAEIQFISFGPVAVHQRAFRIEYWPDKRNVVGRQLAEVLKKQDEAALEPKRFATTTVGVQGLPALERLLFEDGALDLVKPDAPGAAFRCKLLAAIGTNLSTIAHEIVAGWIEGDSSFLSRIEHPSADDEELPSGRDAAGRLLNDLLTATIAMRDMKLLPALGDSAAKAKPQAAEYWRSGQSIAVLDANVEGFRSLFNGAQGLGNLLSAQPGGEKPNALLVGAVEIVRNDIVRLKNLKLPLDKLVVDDQNRQYVTQLNDHLAGIRDLLAGPVTTTLNIPVGFNALDGD